MDKKVFSKAVKELKSEKWSIDKVNEYFKNLPWLVGCNFIPATAINQLEMFQEDTFDLKRIELELGWASELGFNAIRVYTHFLLWKQDSQGFFKRIDEFLSICDTLGIKVLFVPFDDCWNPEAKIGKQPEPIPSVHNSGWLQSPGRSRILDQESHEESLQYLREFLTRFKDDERIWGWDIYNEPGNEKSGENTLPFLIKAFQTARKIPLKQPITAGVWHDKPSLIRMKQPWKNYYKLQTQVSDFISFHNYSNVLSLKNQISRMKKFNRPLVCTEYMSRPSSRFQTHLPIFKETGVHCFNWGLVDGKTQTKYKWGTKEGAPEPPEWFHEILHFNGSPYKKEETDFLKKYLK